MVELRAGCEYPQDPPWFFSFIHLCARPCAGDKQMDLLTHSLTHSRIREFSQAFTHSQMFGGHLLCARHQE